MLALGLSCCRWLIVSAREKFWNGGGIWKFGSVVTCRASEGKRVWNLGVLCGDSETTTFIFVVWTSFSSWISLIVFKLLDEESCYKNGWFLEWLLEICNTYKQQQWFVLHLAQSCYHFSKLHQKRWYWQKILNSSTISNLLLGFILQTLLDS